MKVTNACSCDVCKNACRRCPCWGTPDEIAALIDAGFGTQLMLDWWGRLEEEGGNIMIVAPASQSRAGQKASWFRDPEPCVFFSNSGLCALHDKGLKPQEGAVYDHTMSHEDGFVLHERTAKTWDNDNGRTVVEHWKKDFLKEEEEEIADGFFGLFARHLMRGR